MPSNVYCPFCGFGWQSDLHSTCPNCQEIKACPHCGCKPRCDWQTCPYCEVAYTTDDYRLGSHFGNLLVVAGILGLCVWILAILRSYVAGQYWITAVQLVLPSWITVVSTGIVFWRSRNSPQPPRYAGIVYLTLVIMGWMTTVMCCLTPFACLPLMWLIDI